jgi:hypothetical protein
MEVTRIGTDINGLRHALGRPNSGYVLACTRRPVTFPVEDGTPDRVTCPRCRVALDAARVRWRY